MIVVLPALPNVVILYLGVYVSVKRLSAEYSEPLLKLTALVVFFAIISCLYYLMLILNQGFTVLLLAMSLLSIFLIWYFRMALWNALNLHKVNLEDKITLWVLVAVLAFTCYFFTFAGKYGGWDAWAIWNFHAAYLYHTDVWKNVLTDHLNFSHNDYPLLLPSLVAFFCHCIGNFTPYVPLLLSFVFLLAIPLTLFYSLLAEDAALFACLSLVILVLDNNYKALACAQEADTILSLFILMVFIHYQKIRTVPDNRIYLLGFICASCAWIKNEGIMFYLLFSICFVLANLKNIKVFGKYFLGALIPTLTIISFKVFFSPANDLVAGNKNNKQVLLTKFLTVDRYVTIFKFGLNNLVNYYLAVIVLIVLTLILNRKFLLSLPFAVILLQLFGYFAVYLSTPYDLAWHLSTSIDRLLLHLYPALLYLLFLSLKGINQRFFVTNNS